MILFWKLTKRQFGSKDFDWFQYYLNLNHLSDTHRNQWKDDQFNFWSNCQINECWFDTPEISKIRVRSSMIWHSVSKEASTLRTIQNWSALRRCYITNSSSISYSPQNWFHWMDRPHRNGNDLIIVWNEEDWTPWSRSVQCDCCANSGRTASERVERYRWDGIGDCRADEFDTAMRRELFLRIGSFRSSNDKCCCDSPEYSSILR
jgi:hypothetical protein